MTASTEKPTVFDETTQAAILEQLRLGNYPRPSCEAAGVSWQALRYWLRKFDAGDPDAQKFADFFHQIKKAVALAESDALAKVMKGDEGWQSKAWFLERRFAARWGRKDRTPVPKPPKPLAEMTDEELDEFGRKVGASGRN